MSHVVLNDQQLQVVTSTSERVEVRDLHGNVIGHILKTPIAEQEYLAEVRRRMANPKPGYTTEQVLAHLKSLERA